MHYTTKVPRDAALLVSRVEEIHPSFRINEVADDYAAKRDAYLTATSRLMSHVEFYFATMRYLAALRDGHAGIISASFASSNGQPLMQLPFDVTYADGRLYALSGGEIGDEITAIGSVPSAQIIAIVADHIYAENEPAKEKLYGQLCVITSILKRARCTFGTDVLVAFHGENGDREEMFRLVPPRFTASSAQADYIIKCETRGDVFVIDLRQFVVHNSVDEACTQIKAAVANGTRKIIIDLRGNGGGNSIVGTQILSALGMTAPKYGEYAVRSEHVMKSWKKNFKKQPKSEGRTETIKRIKSLSDDYRKNDLAHDPPDLGTAVRNENIALAVLTDMNTFSSATMMGVWVQDGKLGTVIGRPSSNAPTGYGDCFLMKLPASRFIVQFTHKKFLRPDVNADQTTLVPDILTARGEDAMAVALEFLADKQKDK